MMNHLKKLMKDTSSDTSTQDKENQDEGNACGYLEFPEF